MSALDRVYVLDKESGITSHDVVARVRRALGRGSTAGHAGTLDPFATGVLVVATGRATRIIRFLSATIKVYLADIALGATTDTDDGTGTMLVERPVTVTREDVDSALGAFRGTFSQVPPQISAVWVDGERMYRRVRRGETVEAPPRDVHVRALDVLECEPPRVRIRVTCSAGTYIRAIARDLGEALGCGAHLAALRREAAGPFTLEGALPTARLCDVDAGAVLTGSGLSVEEALAFLPTATLTWEQAERTVHGQTPPWAGVHLEGDTRGHTVATVRAPDGHLLAVIHVPDADQPLPADARMEPLRVLSTPAEVAAAARRDAEVTLA